MTDESGARAAYRQRGPVASLMLFRLNLYWLGLSVLWGGLSIVYLPDRVEALVGPDIKGTMLGLITAVGVTAAIAVQPLAGGLSDRAWSRWGRRRPMMLAGALATSVFILLLSLTASYAALLALILCAQISENTSRGAYKGVLPDLVGITQMSRASSVNGIFNISGVAIGAAIAGVMLDAGVVWGFLIVGALTLALSAIASFALIPAGPLFPAGHQPRLLTELGQVVSQTRAHPGFVRVIISRLVFFGAVLASDNTLLYNLRDRLGIDNPGQATSVLLGILLISAVLVAWPAGMFGDRFGRKKVVYAACGLGVIASLSAAFIVSFGGMVVAVSLLGMALGMFTAGDWALLVDKLPKPESAGLYLGLANFAGAGGDALGTLWAGIALDLGNRVGHLWGFSAVYLIMGALMALAAFILRPLQDEVAVLAVDPAG